jgi:gamma-glutamylcyclotransferase (GGCT)/AIG2-like uncharacterized protein YtfP
MTHKLFVYGTLKKGGSNHKFLCYSKFLGTLKTQEHSFDMVELGSIPGVVKGGSSAIEGELYEIDDDVLKLTDALEGNGSLYERSIVTLDNGETAWLYFYLNRWDAELTKFEPDHNGVVVWNESKVKYFWSV